jgi:hypothetical protein
MTSSRHSCMATPHLKHPVDQSLDLISCRQHSDGLRGAASIIMRPTRLITALGVAQHRCNAWEVFLALGLIGVGRCPDLLLVLLARREHM